MEVADAGHWLQVSHPEQVNQALLQWLDDTAKLPRIRSSL
jgi:pimeloyl-ACP methyl ester carboxylesterase